MTPATILHQFSQERDRLLATLGAMTAGGLIENIQHIGATSVPTLESTGCVDIAVAVWPFPLEPAPRAAVEAFGYTLVTGYEGAPEQRFQNHTGELQLFFVEAGTAPWVGYQLLRDYLTHSVAARERYSARTATDKAPLLADLQREAETWWIGHSGFTPVENVARELQAFTGQWCISSGWALDLHVGRVKRVHHDVDVVVARADQLALQTHLTERGWKFVTPLDKRLEPWPKHMRLELPRHQAHAHRDGAFIDFLLTDFEPGLWRYRRDPRVVRHLEQALLHTSAGLPYLAPELVLLFKSKNTSGQERSKDSLDFERLLPHLAPEPRAWLKWALLATEPEHPWIEKLG